MTARAVVAALLAALLGAPAAPRAGDDPEPWKLELDEEGIVVHSRELPGTAVREVRLEAEVDAPPRVVRAVLADHEAAPETIPRVAEARVLAREGPVAWVYQRIDVPVLNDRDYTVRVVEEEVEGVPGAYRIRFEATVQHAPPPRSGVVRVKLIRGAWEFLPLADGSRTRATYTLLVDPGGIIPAFVANIAGRKAAPDVLRAVRTWAASPRYAGGEAPPASDGGVAAPVP